MSCENIGQGEEIKYKAAVELININNGMTVGRAFAICSNLENGKRNYAEFAIASTAMTRATGKAYRLPLGWLMSAAGYSPCPAEEMDSVVDTNEQAVEAKKEPIRPTPHAKAEEKPEFPIMATVKQKSELLLLLNHESVSKEEKERGIESINKLTEETAAEAIKKLKHRRDKYDLANH